MSTDWSEPHRLHPATLLVRWLKIVPQALAGGIGLAAGVAKQGFGGILIFAAIAAAIGLVFALLYWWRFTYRLGAGEVVIEKGLLQRQRRVIPFDRIQDIAIEQRLLARLFGTAKVKLETGGSAKDEGHLDMIALADAEALRDRIRRGKAGAAVTDDAVLIEPVEEPVLFAMDLPRLLVAGLFNFSLVFLAVIGGVVQYLDQFGLIRWRDLITSERADQAAGFVSVPLILSFVAIVLLLGIIAGMVRMVTTNFGFRLTRAEAGFRRRRGLLTLTEVVIPLRRTQVALIESGPIGRWFGWYALSFQTLGADRKEGGVQVAAPFARMEELLPVLAEAGFPVPPPRETFHGPPARGLLHQASSWLALALLAGALAAWVQPYLIIPASIMLAFAIVAVLKWRRHGHALDARALFVSHGFFKRRLWVLPYEKTQAISLSRGPIQRGLRLASLQVDTPGAPAMHSQAIVDLDVDEARLLADRMLGLFKQARAIARLQQS